MEIAIIVSDKDPAGLNIKQNLLNHLDETKDIFHSHKVLVNKNTRLFTTTEDSIHAEEIDKQISDTGFIPELMIFATKHQSASGIHSLSVHSPGNWDRAEHGGKDKELNIAPSDILRFCLFELERVNNDSNLDYEVIQECTHHGPSLTTPTIFIEIGSDESSWIRSDAGAAISEVILKLINTLPDIPKYKPALGIGGPHHTPAFTKLMHNSNLAFGHVCPKYMLEYLDKDIIQQAIEKTKPKAEIIILDWKGLGSHKEKLKAILDELNVEYLKSHNVNQSKNL